MSQFLHYDKTFNLTDIHEINNQNIIIFQVINENLHSDQLLGMSKPLNLIQMMREVGIGDAEVIKCVDLYSDGNHS